MEQGNGETDIATIVSIEDWLNKSSAMEKMFRHLLGYMPENYYVPLEPKIEDITDKGCYVSKTISYNVAKDERIRCYLLLPKNVCLPVPAAITLHPTTPLGKEQTVGNGTSDRDKQMSYALHLVNMGIATLSYDIFGANQRCYKNLKDFDTSGFYEEFPDWSVRGKDIWDVSRAVDLLEMQEEIDESKIGCIGHSQGGGITIDTMVLEKRIKVGVSSCGYLPSRLSKNPFNWCRTEGWVGIPNLRPFAICGKLYPIDLHEKIAMIAPRRIMVQMALNDCNYSIGEADELRAKMDNLAKNVDVVFDLFQLKNGFKLLLHTEGHNFLKSQRELAYDFLEENLFTS